MAAMPDTNDDDADDAGMAAIYRMRRSYASAFYVDEKRLRLLDTILKVATPTPVYDVWFSDGLLASFVDVEHVLRQANVTGAEVVEIGARKVRSEGTVDTAPIRKVSVTIGGYAKPAVDFTVTGTEEVPLRDLVRRLDDWVRATKPWYAPIATHNVPNWIHIQ